MQERTLENKIYSPAIAGDGYISLGLLYQK